VVAVGGDEVGEEQQPVADGDEQKGEVRILTEGSVKEHTGGGQEQHRQVTKLRQGFERHGDTRFDRAAGGLPIPYFRCQPERGTPDRREGSEGSGWVNAEPLRCPRIEP